MVRIGEDIEVHNVLRRFEVAASRAAEAAGISPAVVHAEPGAIVFRHIEGRTLAPADVREPAMLERILPLVRRCHTEIPKHFRGPAPFFWVFQVIRDYAARLREDRSRMVAELPRPARRCSGTGNKRSGRSSRCSATTTCSPPT